MATFALFAQDADVYIPLVCITRVGRRKHVVRPFFASRLFVRDDGRGVDYINETRGVECVECANDGEPLRVPVSFVNSLLRREDDDGHVQVRGETVWDRHLNNETRALLMMTLLRRGELV